MAKQESIKFSGCVLDSLPGSFFKVELENGHKVTGVISGKIRKIILKFCQAIRLT